jgi:DNA-binding IclR family transcriptional regulator
MRVLCFLGHSPQSEFTLSELARALSINKSSCLSILTALEEFGFVVRNSDSLRYAIGPAHIGLGTAAAQRYDFIDVAAIELDRLSRDDGLYWNLGTMAGMEMIVLAASAPRVPSSPVMRPGQRVALTPPLGLVYIAWAPSDLVQRWLQQAIRAGEDADPEHLYRCALGTTRERGFSVGLQSQAQVRLIQSLSQLADGPEWTSRARALLEDLRFDEFLLVAIDADREYPVTFLSAPVLDDAGRLIGAITIGGFTRLLPGREILVYGDRLKDSAQRIARAHAGRHGNDDVSGPAGAEAG